MKKLWSFLWLLAAGVALDGCSVMKQVEEAQNFARCEFKLTGVSETQLGDVDVQNVKKLTDLSLKKAAKVADILTSKNVPLTFNLNLQVRNPNDKSASMNKLEWTLFIDDREMLSGALVDKIVVGAGVTTDFTVPMAMDLRKAMSGESKEAMTRLIFNVAGSGQEPTHIMLRVKPWIDIAGYLIEYPGAIDIKTEFTAEHGRRIQKGLKEQTGR